MKIFNYFRNIYFINALLFFIVFYSLFVFFTQNYENVLEIYKDLENIRHCENISRIFPESGWRKLLRSETSISEKLIAI